MEAVDYRDTLRVSAGRMKWWRDVDRWRGKQRMEEEEDEELVEVFLRGRAPWGFTVRGGSEHREPLLITKVEAGSVAAAVQLRAGDEMVSVNAVPLSGSRQEAISLVKSSYKSLRLVVRRAKMVDVVTPRTMPSETEVHVARSFLTKILRSSMRKNDPGPRPHSWHSPKLTEEESEPAAREATPAAVWQPKHEARPEESSNQRDQQQHTCQFNSVSTMERLERPSHPYPPDCLSPAKYSSSAEPFCAQGGKRDSPGLSCFSAGSSPPIHDPRKGTSTENIFFKGIQSEGVAQGDRPRYLQNTLGNGGWEGLRPEDQPASRVSFAGRASVGPVWQVPEKKKSQSPPPPPPPPFRSDSFVATKVFPYPEGPKNHGRSVGKVTESNNQNGLRSQHEKTSEARRSLNPLPTKDFLHPSTAADHNHNQLHPNRLFSLSSNDVRHYIHPPAHQRQYSDESPFYLQTRTAPPAKTQSVGSYYRSLQDLPTNAFSRKYTRHSTASMAICSVSQETGGPGPRYWHGLTGKHGAQAAELKARQGKSEGCRAETDKNHGTQSNEPGFSSFPNMNIKAKYSLPQTQMPYGEIRERNGHSHLGNGLHYEHQEASAPSRNQEDAAKRSETHSNDMKRHFQQSSDRKVCLSRHQDPWVPQEDHRISPLKTPLLHSLAQETRSLSERQPTAANTTSMTSQEASDSLTPGSGKACRRSDRYATTLRKEIQQKRAQLQKSRSAATLTCEAEDEDTEDWRSTEASASSAISFSNTYKDHLKEAQARVLQATSFQRRDLEPVGPEAPVVKASNGRVRGRKRLHLAKRTHSFSEPDKIDKLGMEGESQSGSFGERRKLSETKPAFSRPVPKSGQGANVDTDPEETGNDRTNTREPEDLSTDHLSPGHREQVLLEQQRLGTFAEYQATWNKQKKSTEGKTQGRYHSAENILDTGGEEKNVCIHERSRSSPSADFYAQGIHSPWIDPHAQQSSPTTRLQQEAGHNPQLLPSFPRKEAPVAVLPDHRTKPDAASPSHATLFSGPRSLSPKPATELANSLPPPPPRTSLGPETTSSSQEFLCGAQADPLPPASTPDSQRHHASTSPRMGRMSRGGVEEEKKEQRSPSPPLSALSLPSADRARSPSPLFAPLRLTDKPPAVSVQDDSTLRWEDESRPAAVMDVSSPVRKVPVRIVHAESGSDREARAYLPPNNNDTCSFFQPLVPSLSSAQRPASSLFTAFTRQTAQDPEHASRQEPLPKSNVEEEAKRAELARDIMGRDKSLVDILDQSGRRTTMDLMEGLFPTEEQILEGALQRRRASAGSRLPTSSPRTTDRREDDDLSASAAASLVPSSSYYNTSAPKAELLIKMKDMQEELEEQDSEDELDVDLASKKQELICSLARKLEVLREARQSLQEDVEDNEALGREVEATVQRLCQTNQLDKFRMFVGDLDKVVSLLLSLSGRLARVENALNSLEDEAPPEEKRTLTEKRKLLMRQHEDAKELKENLDRRERLVSAIMEAHLDAESLDDYRHFVKMKSALIIEQRKLEDKIKLGEEQLKCLLDSLPMEQRPPL